MLTMTTKTSSAMRALLVIWPPQVSETAESLMACAGLAVLALRLELVEQRRAQLGGLVVVQRLRPDLNGGRRPVADDDDRLGILAEGVVEHLFDLLGGGAVGGHRNLGAALEVDPEGEPANEDARDGDQQDRTTDGAPQLAPPDDLEGPGAGVEPGEEVVVRQRGRPRRRGVSEVAQFPAARLGQLGGIGGVFCGSARTAGLGHGLSPSRRMCGGPALAGDLLH